MRIIAFIEARQRDVIRKILEHCGLRKDPPPRAPPKVSTPPHAGHRSADPDSRRTYEVDPDFLEHLRRERMERADLPTDF